MLIRCQDCKNKGSIGCRYVSRNKPNTAVIECSYGEQYETFDYYYRLAEQLYCAVLESLLAHKSEGEFRKDIYNLTASLEIKRREMTEALDNRADAIQEKQSTKEHDQRIIEKCGDAAACLAAIIDAAGSSCEKDN